MRMRLPGQELCWVFAYSFWHLRAHEAAVVEEKLKEVKIGTAEAPAQAEVIT